ncbi:MAG: PspC domain-containing protein [Candidatus Micrarchaeota archaeon]
MAEMRRLYRSTHDRILGGVCGGFGDYFNVDPNLVRLLFVLLCFAGGAGIILYLVAWLLLPEEQSRRRG